LSFSAVTFHLRSSWACRMLSPIETYYGDQEEVELSNFFSRDLFNSPCFCMSADLKLLFVFVLIFLSE
jgi:hypothetical protein